MIWAPVVIELDPVGGDPHRMLLGLEAVTMHTSLFQCPHDVLNDFTPAEYRQSHHPEASSYGSARSGGSDNSRPGYQTHLVLKKSLT